jgi:DNA polymerase-3 subunit beta
LNFSVTQQQLLQALTTVGKVVSPRAMVPVLTGVLVEAREGSLQLLGSDNETWLHFTVPATVAAAGSLVIPARYLTELVRRIAPETVTATADLGQRSLNLSWSRGRIALNGFDAGEFPLVPEVNPTIAFELPRYRFRQMVRQTVFAASSDATRAIFTGILIVEDPEGRALEMVATDGFRLARTVCPLEKGMEQGLQAVIPGRVMTEVAGMLDGEGPAVQIGVGRALVSFSSGSFRLVSRLIEGQFPPYRQVVPRDFRVGLTVDRAALEGACDLAFAALRDSGQPVCLEMAEGVLRLTGTMPDRGQIEEELAATVEGDPFRIAFNPRYLLEGVKAIDADRVICRFTTPTGAACLQAEGDDAFLYIVLPVRLE